MPQLADKTEVPTNKANLRTQGAIASPEHPSLKVEVSLQKNRTLTSDLLNGGTEMLPRVEVVLKNRELQSSPQWN